MLRSTRKPITKTGGYRLPDLPVCLIHHMIGDYMDLLFCFVTENEHEVKIKSQSLLIPFRRATKPAFSFVISSSKLL